MRALLFAALVGCTSSDPTGAPAPPCAVIESGPRAGDKRCAPTSAGVTCCTRFGFAINTVQRCTDFATQIVLHCEALPENAACAGGIPTCVATAGGSAFLTSSMWPGFAACTEEQRSTPSTPCPAR